MYVVRDNFSIMVQSSKRLKASDLHVMSYSLYLIIIVLYTVHTSININ